MVIILDKYLIFSHESDIDGIGCVILAKLAFPDVDYILLPNVQKLELNFRFYLESQKLNSYSKVFITDLALYEPSLSIVANSYLRNKILVFDHHQMAIYDKMNRYDFTKIVEKDDSGSRCATDLFFEYLVSNDILMSTHSISEFVRLTKLEDTWQWKKSGVVGENAHDLAILFNSIGAESYLEKCLDVLHNDAEIFSLSEQDKLIIERKKQEYIFVLKSIMETVEYFIDEFGNRFGIVYADYEYRNELVEFIKSLDNPNNIKYLIIVAMNKGEFGQKSYRSIEPSFDVNKIAMQHGGGGHLEAAAVNITEEQKEKSLKLNKKQGLKYLSECKYDSN